MKHYWMIAATAHIHLRRSFLVSSMKLRLNTRDKSFLARRKRPNHPNLELDRLDSSDLAFVHDLSASLWP